MADLSFTQGADPVTIVNDSSGNQAAVNSDGSTVARTNAQQLAVENKLFSTNWEVSSIGTTEIPVVLFRNPSGSGKTVKFDRLTMSNFATVNSFIRIRAYGAPTVTSDGTGLTEICTHVGQAGPSSVTFSSPTVSANGTRFAQWEIPAFQNALIIPLDLLFILDANAEILLTAQADGTNRVFAGSLIWAEV